MKIDFKKPRYVLPLIALPFILLFFYVFQSFSGEQKAEGAVPVAVSKDGLGINMNMPGVSPSVKQQGIRDKLSATQRAMDMQGQDNLYNSDSLKNKINPSMYPDAMNKNAQQIAIRRLDSLRTALRVKQTQNHFSTDGNTASENDQPQSPDQILEQIHNAQQAYNKKYGINQPEQQNEPVSSANDDMKNFRERMRIIDSMQKGYMAAANPNPENGKEKIRKRFDPARDSSFSPVHVSLHKYENEHTAFNTIKPFKTSESIQAIIDENEKVYASSRVRIRLLTDIYAEGIKVPKGTYLYAMVTGFQAQRINLSITSINLNGKIIPVHLDVYDQDGYLGLYVPGSDFREFTKEIGTQGTNGMSVVYSPEYEKPTTSLLRQLFQSTTNSVSRYINKDKAFVKYNYIVYLKEKKRKF